MNLIKFQRFPSRLCLRNERTWFGLNKSAASTSVLCSSHFRCLSISQPLWRKHANHDRQRRPGEKLTFGQKLDRIFDSAFSNFPFIHKFYKQLGKGFQHQKNEYKTWRSVSARVAENPNYKAPYREQKSIFNIKASLVKSAAIIPIFLLPMGFFLIVIPIAVFPQYTLPRCYWSMKQRKEFLTKMHRSRLHHSGTIIHHLTYLRNNHESSAFQRCLEPIVEMMNGQKVPTNDDLRNLKDYCRNSENPLHLHNMPPLLLFAFCNVNTLWQYQPSSWMTYYLQRRVSLILELDQKLAEENLIYELSDTELQDATFLRGLNTAQLSKGANQYWLQNWVNHTKMCDELDSSYILHAMVLQAYNYTELRYQRKPFG